MPPLRVNAYEGNCLSFGCLSTKSDQIKNIRARSGLFDMALKNLGFLGFLKNKNLMSDLNF